MPRKDKTFSDKDVIRIFVKHLTPEEQINVSGFIEENLKEILDGKLKPISNILLDISQIGDTIKPLLDVIGFIPGIGTLVDGILLVFDLIDQTIVEIET